MYLSIYPIIEETFPQLPCKNTEWMRKTELALVKDAKSFVEYKNPITWKDRVIEFFIGCNVNMQNTSFMVVPYSAPSQLLSMSQQQQSQQQSIQQHSQQQQSQQQGGLPLQQQKPTSSSCTSFSSSFTSFSSSSSDDDMEVDVQGEILHVQGKILPLPLPLPLSSNTSDLTNNNNHHHSSINNDTTDQVSHVQPLQSNLVPPLDKEASGK